MEIGGFQKTSLIDFPGMVSAVVFTRGCRFRCPYCHNPQLVAPSRYAELIPEDQVLRHLERRQGKLQAVVVSGGEPTEQDGLIRFLERLKLVGYPVKLDTNGIHPGIVEEAMTRHLIQYIAMDVKAPLARYQEVVRVPVDTQSIERSVSLILASKLPHEFRTTWDRSLLAPEDLMEIARWLEGCGAWYIQNYRAGDNLESGTGRPASPPEIVSLRILLGSRRVPWRIR